MSPSMYLYTFKMYDNFAEVTVKSCIVYCKLFNNFQWQNVKRYSFRMGEECDVAYTDYNLKTQWVYEPSLYINL
jgi:hypothetical protein